MHQFRHSRARTSLKALAACLALTFTTGGEAPVRSAGAPSAVTEQLSTPSLDGLPRRLVLALDGVPHDLFEDLQRRGHFADFRQARRMVSTFPSLTDVAFSTISGTGAPEGYQVMRFDRTANRVVGNSMRSLSGEAHRNVPADTQPRSVTNRVLGYIHPRRTALIQLRQLQEELLESSKETFVGYIEATDYLLHIHGREAAERFLIRLDAALKELNAAVVRRTGRDLAVDIVSDHGSTHGSGRTVRLGRSLRACGFERSKRLLEPHDVAYTRAGIISSVAIHSDPAQAEAVARCLATCPGVDLTAFRRADAVVVLSSSGEAEIRGLPGSPATYDYRVLDGNPLDLAALLGVSSGPGEHLFDQEDIFRNTLTSARPDPVRRLWRAFHGEVLEPSEVLVSLEDGYESSNRFVHLLGALRGRQGTHGSLTRAASLGLVTSNWRSVWDMNSEGGNEWLFGSATFEALRAPVRSALLKGKSPALHRQAADSAKRVY